MKNRMIRCLIALTLGIAAASPGHGGSGVYPFPQSGLAPIHNRWTRALKPWADEIEKRSEGRIVIEPYFAQAISKQAEVVESVRTGIADHGRSHLHRGRAGTLSLP